MIHQCKKSGEIRFFEDTGIYRLLFKFNDKDELRDICNTIKYRIKKIQVIISVTESA